MHALYGSLLWRVLFLNSEKCVRLLCFLTCMNYIGCNSLLWEIGSEARMALWFHLWSQGRDRWTHSICLHHWVWKSKIWISFYSLKNWVVYIVLIPLQFWIKVLPKLCTLPFWSLFGESLILQHSIDIPFVTWSTSYFYFIVTVLCIHPYNYELVLHFEFPDNCLHP